MRCGTHARGLNKERPCHWNHLPEWKITRALQHWLKGFATPERIEEALAELGGGEREAQLRKSLDRAESEAESFQQQRERLALALAQGQMDGDIYRQADNRLLARRDAAQGRVIDLRRQLDSLPDLEQRRRTLENLYRYVWDWVDRDDPSAASHLLQSAGIVVWCEDGEITGIACD